MFDIKQTGRLGTTNGRATPFDRFELNEMFVAGRRRWSQSLPQEKIFRFFAFVKNLLRSAYLCVHVSTAAAGRHTIKELHYFPIDCRCKFDSLLFFSGNIIHCSFRLPSSTCRFRLQTSLTLMAIYFFRVICLGLFFTSTNYSNIFCEK